MKEFYNPLNIFKQNILRNIDLKQTYLQYLNFNLNLNNFKDLKQI